MRRKKTEAEKAAYKMGLEAGKRDAIPSAFKSGMGTREEKDEFDKGYRKGLLELNAKRPAHRKKNPGTLIYGSYLRGNQ